MQWSVPPTLGAHAAIVLPSLLAEKRIAIYSTATCGPLGVRLQGTGVNGADCAVETQLALDCGT